MKCKHKNKIRLYERSNTWKSTPYYLCQDCREVIQIGFEEIKPKNMEKSIREKTHDAFSKKDE